MQRSAQQAHNRNAGKWQQRDGICARPVLVNSWEAAYFNFTGETIVELAREAAGLGIDMVVMDDGWFGKREDDNSGLGDWQVNEKKLGCSLGELVRRVNAEGVKFGIWIEPEMISEDSDLYREHPDWAMQNPGRNPARGRNQLVLDFPGRMCGSIFSIRSAECWIRAISSTLNGI